ncbi:MAG: dicarboxylate/amino acid:cation symporter, partial [Cyanobacteria bacterium]|nr:dicarboxylate/amino acid:cation symporter [Cyanobacteriota bacterium]MDW8201996.1 dicarboxylate/amino acid:cation symporter [Cyanobacteriota bacterium SKYGB_h_bin112]
MTRPTPITLLRSVSLSTWILFSLGIGILAGAGLHEFAPAAIVPLDHYLLSPLGNGFLRIIQFVVVPTVFCSLILGLTRIQNASQVGRYAAKLLSLYAITSAIAVAIGLIAALILQPGSGFGGLSAEGVAITSSNQSILDWLVSLIPVNPFEALSTGNLLQVIGSAALIGIACQRIGHRADQFLQVITSVYDITETILSMILYLAPVGVFALITSVVAIQGLGLIIRLFLYVAGLFLASLVMAALYMLMLLVLRAKPIEFLKAFAPAFSLGFGTASSNAVLPIGLRNAQEVYGIREEVASFAIPLGTALKRDGSAILQSFNALFIAQIYHIPITPPLLMVIAISAFFVSFSTPGVPGSAIIMMTTVLSAAGLPLEGVTIVAGIDRLTDGF